MKIGVKFYPDSIRKAAGIIEELAGRADFIEIMAIKGEDFTSLEKARHVTIHCMHTSHGFNPADKAAHEKSRELLDFSIGLADTLRAKVIVVHPGRLNNPGCSLENTIEFYGKNSDNRLHIENMPYRESGLHFTGRAPAEMGRILDGTGLKFCLDFGHSAASAYGHNASVMGFAGEFLRLKPSYFHFYDGVLKSEICSHMHLQEGEQDVAAYRKILPPDAVVCLETKPIILEKFIADIDFLRGKK